MIEIGTAAASDIPELVRLRLAYFDEEFGTLPPEKLTAIREQLPLYFTAHLNRDCFCYTAKADGTAHACACAILCVTEKPANPHFPNGKTGSRTGRPAMCWVCLRSRNIADRAVQPASCSI